jgi:hypothetical protein
MFANLLSTAYNIYNKKFNHFIHFNKCIHLIKITKLISEIYLRYEVITVTTPLFWDMTACRLVDR